MRVLLGVAALLVVVASQTAFASAATQIDEPSSSPHDVAASSSGKPEPFTVTVSGFRPFQSVYIEQCNGRHPSAPNWQPSLDCDIGSSPAAAIADTKGVATFTATDANHAFHPFVGVGPQQLFNCLPAGAASPKNGLKDYDDCQVRISSNNTTATSDQLFLTLRLPGAGDSSGGSGDSETVAMVVALVGAIAVLVVVGVVIGRRRSRHPAT